MKLVDCYQKVSKDAFAKMSDSQKAGLCKKEADSIKAFFNSDSTLSINGIIEDRLKCMMAAKKQIESKKAHIRDFHMMNLWAEEMRKGNKM